MIVTIVAQTGETVGVQSIQSSEDVEIRMRGKIQSGARRPFTHTAQYTLDEHLKLCMTQRAEPALTRFGLPAPFQHRQTSAHVQPPLRHLLHQQPPGVGWSVAAFWTGLDWTYPPYTPLLARRDRSSQCGRARAWPLQRRTSGRRWRKLPFQNIVKFGASYWRAVTRLSIEYGGLYFRVGRLTPHQSSSHHLIHGPGGHLGNRQPSPAGRSPIH